MAGPAFGGLSSLLQGFFLGQIVRLRIFGPAFGQIWPDLVKFVSNFGRFGQDVTQLPQGDVLWQLGKDEKDGTLAGRQGVKGVERVLLACCLKGVGFWIAPLLACFFGGVLEGVPPQSHFAC